MKRLNHLLRSKRRMKVYANTTLLVLALIFAGLISIWVFVPVFPNAVGKLWTSVYVQDFRDGASDAIASASTGSTDSLADIIVSGAWQRVSKGDRAWPAKRKMLQALIQHLESSSDYSAMRHWADYWRAQDARDVDAMAYWYEALRHTEEGEVEGQAGLAKALLLFPDNFELIRFNSNVMAENGDIETSRKLHDSLLKLATSNWRLEWRRKSRQVASWYFGLAFSHLARLDFSAASSSFGSAFDLVSNSKLHRKLKRLNGEQAFSISSSDPQCCSIEIEIPTTSSTINIFPPAVTGISVSDISITVSGTEHRVSTEDIQGRYMFRNGKWFHSAGDEESHVRFSVMHILAGENVQKAPATLRFRAEINLVPTPAEG
ncbi:MAG: hypothetical protein ACI8P9_000419 [Parasphingorhabdus sp.]|jgi:hypothetical protein